MPIPSLSISLGLRAWLGFDAVLLAVLRGAGVSFVVAAAEPKLVVLFFASSSAFSASGSYPNFSIRSASALAAFSAASKSISSPTTFLAPSFCAGFLPLRIFARFAPGPPSAEADLRIAEDEVVRMAVGAGRAVSVSSVLEASGEGDLERACEPLALPAERKGEAVRETAGGVPVLEGGLLGRLIVGLSQEEKKSSAGSPAGVDVPSPVVLRASSVMMTSSG